LQVSLVAKFSVDDPPQLSEEAITEMRKAILEEMTGSIGDRDEE